MDRNAMRWSPAFLMIIGALSALSTFTSKGQAASVESGLKTVMFRGHAFLVREVDPTTEDLRLYWAGPSEPAMRDFTALEKRVRNEGDRLLFAANAGMFQPDFSPVGLLILNGQQVSPLNLRERVGNFFLKPNGVFVLTTDHRAEVMESSSFTTFLPSVQWATQSGPLLVHDGEIHPDFIEGSINLNVRSGVGVRKDGMVILALSRGINFYDFALFFQAKEKCPNALFLDGSISDFHSEGQVEPQGVHSFGPMFGIVRKR